MYEQQGQRNDHQRHFRFYLFMVTLVVGGIFLLLFINNNEGTGFSLTSAVIGSADQFVEQAGSSLEIAGNPQVSTNELQITLTSDKIASIKKEVQIDTLELKFENFDTVINVNDDKLELNNLKEVTLRLSGFFGMLNLVDQTLSLGGSVKSLEVNGLVLSSDKDIKITFNELEYQYLSLYGIKIDALEIPAGQGFLNVADKLSYTLNEDFFLAQIFTGDIFISKDNETAVSLKGLARDVSVSGTLLNLKLQ